MEARRNATTWNAGLGIMEAAIEITALNFRGTGFPSFEKLKAKGWRVPGGDDGVVKDSLLKTIDGQLIMLIKHGADITGAIRPVDLDMAAKGMDKLAALELVATIFEDLE
jgi:hypothetical protein